MIRKDKKKFVKIATDMYKLMEEWENDLILYDKLSLLIDDYIIFKEFTKIPYTTLIIYGNKENLVLLELIK